MTKSLVYLDSYTLQSDLRIRLPKSAITNMNIIPGETRLNIFYDNDNNSIVLRVCPPDSNNIDRKSNGNL